MATPISCGRLQSAADFSLLADFTLLATFKHIPRLVRQTLEAVPFEAQNGESLSRASRCAATEVDGFSLIAPTKELLMMGSSVVGQPGPLLGAHDSPGLRQGSRVHQVHF
ncbi:hypothetical protein NDU88_000809 [Pleurodeles waltl]|uniref:Uncharacterized protein n=1 Tax=Pleurodeles waltl TaxID=8319 RepID=A0AAV7L7Z1_PLEWA|nr:hypothetical protein NDU88_000809 [Pleurodeles waltl]